jgi:hypothetical protein
MRLSFHVILAEAALPETTQWQNICQEMGFGIEFDPTFRQTRLSKEEIAAILIYRGIVSPFKVHLSPVSDVADICDELSAHILESQTLAVNVDFNGEYEELPGISIAVSVLTHLSQGVLYVEEDNAFYTPVAALENARDLEAKLNKC